MRLLVHGDSIRIVQMGPDFLLVEAPSNHPPGVASVVLQVDESESRWDVRLPDGISTESERIAIAKVGG
jgi:hypothetical protein